MGIREGEILAKRKVWVKLISFLLIFLRPVGTVLSSHGGHMRTGLISGSWFSEPWTIKVVTGQAWLVVSSVNSSAGLGGCFVLKGREREKLKAE